MRIWFLLICFVVLPCWRGQTAPSLPAIAVVDEEGFVAAADQKGPQLRVAIWPDGRLIWENNPGRFLSSQIDTAKVKALLDRFEQAKVFDPESFRHSWRVPDGGQTVIWLQSGSQHTRLEVWREDDDDRSAEFQKFHRVWKDLRAAVDALLPKEGKLYTGSTQLHLPKE